MIKNIPSLRTIITIGILLLISSTLQAGEYTNIDIGFPDTIHTDVQVVSINNTGQLVGTANVQFSINRVIFVLTSDNGVWFRDLDFNGTNDLMEIINVPDSFSNYNPRAINDAGQVVGYVRHNPTVRLKGFLWENGIFTILPPPNNASSFIESWAVDINNAGQIIGQMWSAINGKSTIAIYMWDNGIVTQLGEANNVDFWLSISFRTVMNDNGEVAGTRSNNGVREAIVWRNGSIIDLPTLGGNSSEAIGINNLGQIIGISKDVNGNWESVVWENDIPQIASQDGARKINNKGQTVGRSFSGSPNHFLWLPEPDYGFEAGVYDIELFNPQASSIEIVDINDSGFIAIHGGKFGSLRAHAWVMIPVLSPTITVNSIGDAPDNDSTDGECNTGNLAANGDPECTMRAAIEEANAQAGLDTIIFNIPGTGVPSIQPIASLPEITDTVFIDGATQPSTGKVEISGNQIFSGVVNGLQISSGKSTISNLLINNFSGNGLSLITGDSNIIDGVLIGVGPDGIEPRGNLRNGINISNSSYNKIGSSIGNTIAQNGGAGIYIASGEGNRIRNNSIFSNSGLGIDLAPVGVNPNDPLDSDIGPNTLINTPTIDSFFNQDIIMLFGHVNGAAGAAYTIDIFANGFCNPVGFGDGKLLVGSTAAIADGSGLASFVTTLNHMLDSSEVFTATATDSLGNTSEFSPCIGLIHLEIVDVDKILLPDLQFIVSSIKYSKPNFTETLIDTFMTDSKGIISLPSNKLSVGDSLKVYRYLGSVPAVRHPNLLGTMYSIHLDNAKIDSLGKISYLEIGTADTQRVVMDHSTFAYNMLISIAWDAEVAYLDAWKPSIRKMANHLYDVSDGQMTIDTVIILDNSAGWDEADVQVHANNVLWPANIGDVGTIFTRPGSNGPFVFPRTGYGSKDDARAGTVTFDPNHFLTPNHYITLLHEFFHYAFVLWDEYKDRFNVYYIETSRCAARQNQFNKYGVMDQHLDGQPYSSEFSSVYRYPSGCRNNRQWWKYGMSCWDHLDTLLTKTYSGVKAPVIRPDERPRKTGLGYIPGPNDNAHIGGASDMDFDVGALVVFPGVHSPPSAGSYNVIVFNNDFTVALGGTTIIHIDKISRKRICQGKTSDQGQLLALGVRVGDDLVAYAQFPRLLLNGPSGIPQWGFGRTTIAKAGDQASESLSGQIGNNLNIVMDTVKGSFPLVPRINLDSKQLTLSLDFQNLFPSLPTVEHNSTQGNLNSYNFAINGNSYIATISDSILKNDFLTIQALDDSSNNFFIPAELSIDRNGIIDGRPLRDGQYNFEVVIDTLNSSIEQSALLTWTYPIIPTGIDSLARQGGDAVALAFYPDVPLVGDNSITIRYADSDFLIGGVTYNDKSSLQIFRWNETGLIWETIGGVVDTTQNVVSAIITQTGVYAAFTTEVTTGINDEVETNDLLPNKFELSQNYPNPFNPTTSISFSLPVASQVKLNIYNILGQVVTTLYEGQLEAGIHNYSWDGSSSASGVYLYRLTTEKFTESKKMILLK